MERSPPSPPPLRAPTHRVRELGPIALLAVACGAVLREPLGCTRSSAAARASNAAAIAAPTPSTDPADASASFASLVARGPLVAPGMREVAHLLSTGDRIEITRAQGRDACVRVAFEASSPVVAKLLDGGGNVLASSAAPTTGGVLGERGPVCIRKGDAVLATAEGPGSSIRWVAWASP